MSIAHTPSSAHQPHAEHDVPHVHVVPVKVLLAVYAILVFFTVATVAVTYVDLGNFNIWMALLIAVVKAGLVAMYFMHLRYDSPFNGIILITALLFVSLFIGLAVLDTHEYQSDYAPPAGMPAGK